jgi:hypothetical protein
VKNRDFPGRVLAVGVTLAVLAGCEAAPPPTAPGTGDRLGGELPPSLAMQGLWPAGLSRWTWREIGGPRRGPAVLWVGAGRRGRRWRWWCPQGRPPPGPLQLVPQDTASWLPLRVGPVGDPCAWLPLPRVPVASAAYPDAVALLRALTAPRFGSRVTHWPGAPVPVRIPDAVAGEVDLAACLRAAVAIWNEGADPPWFACADTAGWGVRLVHLQGRVLSPPLSAQITRLDAAGRPLRVHIVVGDNYDEAHDRRYAIRGFVHELGHALFLWGHSRDRNHVLWGRGPPLVAEPAVDERQAAQLLHGLPPGLDLNRYGPVTPR